KYVLNLGENGKAELIDINSKNSVQGTYSYNNSTLSLKVSNFNSTYTREDASYNKNNLILMKDNTNTTSGSTFVMMKISQDEYNKYVK
ncbi:MAG: copper amine oxidase N-terminal domain-containing protein, partial [Peptoanaerobacter stomatis]